MMFQNRLVREWLSVLLDLKYLLGSIFNPLAILSAVGTRTGSPIWSACQSCEKASLCPILMNRQIMANSEKNISEFISDHYVWQQEHGNKLTIRQIVAHLSYTITSGLQCSQIKNVMDFHHQVVTQAGHRRKRKGSGFIRPSRSRSICKKPIYHFHSK